MHNLIVRLNAVIFFGLTVLLILALLCAFSTYLHFHQPVISELTVGDHQLEYLRYDKRRNSDSSIFNFTLKADLRPAFHWNLKQLFVYIVVEYETKNHVLNQQIVWDRIIESKEDANINLKNEKIKYFLPDTSHELRNKTVNLTLHWDHMPLTGRMYFGYQTENLKQYTFPMQYKEPGEVRRDARSSSSNSGGGGGGTSARESSSSSGGQRDRDKGEKPKKPKKPKST